MATNNYEQGVIDHEEPMEAELFELAAREVNWHLSPGETDWKDAVIVQAVRQVLVEGNRTTAVAEAAGISQAWLSQAIGRVREQLEVICSRENWVHKMIVLPPETMALVEHLQNKTIDPLKQLQVQSIAKKRAKKIKAAKSTPVVAGDGETHAKSDGKASVKANGKSNGKANGKSNGKANSKVVAAAASQINSKVAKSGGNGKLKTNSKTV